MYYIGLDVYKKAISYCVKDAAGHVHQEGKVGSTRRDLDAWARTLPQPRMIAMEATIFTGWIYDHLLPHAEKVKVAQPLMLRAIAAAKKKNDKIDARKIADCLRCDFLPECHMASTEIRDRRRVLRFRNLVIKQMVQMKNRVSALLIETCVDYNKRQLHKVGYFEDLMSTNKEVNRSIRPLLKLSRKTIDRSQRLDYALLSSLERDSLLAERLKRPEFPYMAVRPIPRKLKIPDRPVTFQVMRRTPGTNLQHRHAQGCTRDIAPREHTDYGDVYVQTIEKSVPNAMNSRTVEILTDWEPTILSGTNVALIDPATPKRRSLRVVKQLDQLGPSGKERQAVSA